MQRTAVQGSPDMLTAITGVYTPGAARVETEVHPFRRTMTELRIGDAVVTDPRTVTDEDVAHFADFTGGTFYAHTGPRGGGGQPAVRRHRRPRLPGAVPRGGALRRPGPGAGAGQHWSGPAALHQAGQARRQHPGGADLREQDAAQPAAGRGALGRAVARQDDTLCATYELLAMVSA